MLCASVGQHFFLRQQVLRHQTGRTQLISKREQVLSIRNVRKISDLDYIEVNYLVH